MDRSSGYFSGCVFRHRGLGHAAAPVAVVHKVFHRYTVRKKQGGAQSTKDGTGNAPKSMGAQIRRANTVKLEEDIHELLAAWAPHLEHCQRIFISAAKRSIGTLFCDALSRGQSCYVVVAFCGDSHGLFGESVVMAVVMIVDVDVARIVAIAIAMALGSAVCGGHQ